MTAAQRSCPQLINTTHGKGYLVGKDPQHEQVCVQFVRKMVTDSEMLTRYRGDNWACFVPMGDVITESAK